MGLQLLSAPKTHTGNMKVLAVVCLAAVALSQEVMQRDLAADLLRDYPGLCFSSTNLNFYVPGMSWSLFPFCGVATCVEEKGKLIERINDCGPQPKPNEQCKIANLANPECCPQYECPKGVTLEYPNETEVEAQIKKQREAAVKAIKDAAAERNQA